MVNEGSKAIENVKLLEKYIRNVDKVWIYYVTESMWWFAFIFHLLIRYN
jgi:hypothetical protein